MLINILESKDEFLRVLKNSSYLLCVHLGNYIIPLVVVFYLVNILGVEAFGVYALCIAVSAYVQVLIDYGFSFTGCRAVAQNKNDLYFVSKVFWEIITSKILIGFFTVFLCLSCFWFFSLDFNVYVPAIFSVIFLSFTPMWFFQGLEKFRWVTVVNVSGKFLSCIPVLIWVNGPEDLYIVFYSQAIFSFLVMLLVYYYIYKKKLVVRVTIGLVDIKQQLFDGWHIFSATVSSVLVTNSGVLLLGALYSTSVVGVYASVERIVKATASLFVPLSQAIFPINSRAFAEEFRVGVLSVIKTGSFLIFIGFFVSVFLAFSNVFFRNFLGYAAESRIYFIIFSLWLFLGVINNVLGAQFLTASGHSKIYAKCFHVVSATFLVFAYFMIGLYAGLGAVYSLLLAETLLLVLLLIVVSAFLRRKY